MKWIRSSLLFILAFPFLAKAEFRIALLSNFVQDNKSIASSNSTSTMYDLSAHVFLHRENKWAMTVGYYGSQSEEPLDATTEATLKTENPYAGLTYFFGKKSLYSIGAYYSPLVKARYSETNSEEEVWSGSSTLFRFSINPIIYKNLMLHLSVTYSSSSFDEKGSSADVSSVDTFEKSVVTPMVGLSFQF